MMYTVMLVEFQEKKCLSASAELVLIKGNV